MNYLADPLKIRCEFSADCQEYIIDDSSFWVDVRLDIDCPYLIQVLRNYEAKLHEDEDFEPEVYDSDVIMLLGSHNLGSRDERHIEYLEPEDGAFYIEANVPKTLDEFYRNLIVLFREEFCFCNPDELVKELDEIRDEILDSINSVTWGSSDEGWKCGSAFDDDEDAAHEYFLKSFQLSNVPEEDVARLRELVAESNACAIAEVDDDDLLDYVETNLEKRYIVYRYSKEEGNEASTFEDYIGVYVP